MFQCVLFGTFMIWFASITINLGPTFLSGALAASAGSYGSYGPAPSCPLVRGPYRHYVLNALWIGVNAVCVGLTLFHLKKLHRDLTKVICPRLTDCEQYETCSATFRLNAYQNRIPKLVQKAPHNSHPRRRGGSVGPLPIFHVALRK